jgi:hypothetical protein
LGGTHLDAAAGTEAVVGCEQGRDCAIDVLGFEFGLAVNQVVDALVGGIGTAVAGTEVLKKLDAGARGRATL